MYKNAHLYTITLKKKKSKWGTTNFIFVKNFEKRITDTYVYLHIHRRNTEGVILQVTNESPLGVQFGD